jgi:hypothetical protein
MPNVGRKDMTVEKDNVIDIVSNMLSGEICLTISDHLEWRSDHLLTLQEKINAYLRFIESGEIFASYPDAKDRHYVIKVVLLHRPNDMGIRFLDVAKNIVEQAGYGFEYGPISSGYEKDTNLQIRSV